MKKQKKILFIVAGLALTGSLAACGSDESSPTKKVQEEQVTLKLDSTEIYPDENGYFEIKGESEDGATLSANGQDIPMEDGKFTLSSTFTGSETQVLTLTASKKGEEDNAQSVNVHPAKEKVYGLNEEAIVTDSSGNQLYSIKITKVTKDISESGKNLVVNNSYGDNLSNPLEVQVEFKNIGSSEAIGFHKQYLLAYDGDGKQLEDSNYQDGQDLVGQGRTTSSIVWYDLNGSQTTNVQFDYNVSETGKVIKFDIPIN